MKTSWPFHALLLPLFPVLTVYLRNIRQMAPGDLLHPVLFSLVVSLALLGLFALLFRSARAGILVSFLFIWSFSYRILSDLLSWLLRAVHLDRLAMDKVYFPLWVLVLLGIALALVRTRRDLRPAARVLNLASLILVVLSLIRIAGTSARPLPANETAFPGRDADSAGGQPALTLTPPPDPPDVYFLVFDRYPSASVLREVFGFDNSEFMDALRRLGFQVVDTATANYPMTHLSLASTLSMDYLGDRYLGEIHYRPMIQRSQVARALKEAGYRYLHLGSWWEATRRSPLADENLNYSLLLSEFSKALLRTTPFHLFLLKNEQYHQVFYTLQRLEKLPRTKGPKFVFAHLLTPHPPYVIDADGSKLPPERAARRTEEENYLNQIRFLNARLPRLLHTLITESARPPVILLQADEGPLVLSGERGLDRSEKLRIRAGILNACYFPGGEPLLPSGFTPVNDFRLVFNRYFGTNLALRESRVFYWPEMKEDGHPANGDRPFSYVEITDDVVGRPSRPRLAGPEPRSSAPPHSAPAKAR